MATTSSTGRMGQAYHRIEAKSASNTHLRHYCISKTPYLEAPVISQPARYEFDE